MKSEMNKFGGLVDKILLESKQQKEQKPAEKELVVEADEGGFSDEQIAKWNEALRGKRIRN